MQLEARAGADQVLDRRPRLAGADVVENQVALAEGAALGVLAREPHWDAARDQRREGQLLGLRPVDFSLGQRRLATLHLAEQLGVHTESIRHGQQLAVE